MPNNDIERRLADQETQYAELMRLIETRDATILQMQEAACEEVALIRRLQARKRDLLERLAAVAPVDDGPNR